MGEQRCVWSEHVAYAQLANKVLLEQFRSADVELIVAVQPGHLNELPSLLAACNEAGVSVALWPLLSDEAGRWLSASTMALYREHLTHVLTAIPKAAAIEGIVFDLEPPIQEVRKALSTRNLAGWVARRGRRPSKSAARLGELEALIRAVQSAGYPASAVVPPFVLWDKGKRRGLERMLGIAFADLEFDRVWIMAYTSLLEGYGKGFVRRQDAQALLAEWSELAAARFGSRVGIALGVVGGGALGDERPYREVEELASDVRAVTATGIERIALFGLTGILARPPAAQWLTTLNAAPCVAPASAPARTNRARILSFAGRLTSRALSL